MIISFHAHDHAPAKPQTSLSVFRDTNGRLQRVRVGHVIHSGDQTSDIFSSVFRRRRLSPRHDGALSVVAAAAARSIDRRDETPQIDEIFRSIVALRHRATNAPFEIGETRRVDDVVRRLADVEFFSSFVWEIK